MGMPAPAPATKKSRTTAPSRKRPLEPGAEEAEPAERQDGLCGVPPQARGRVGVSLQEAMAGNAAPAAAAPAGWYCALLGRHIGTAVPAPQWYMPVRSHAVRADGVQRAATCGLHAVNHCWTSLLSEFDA